MLRNLPGRCDWRNLNMGKILILSFRKGLQQYRVAVGSHAEHHKWALVFLKQFSTVFFKAVTLFNGNLFRKVHVFCVKFKVQIFYHIISSQNRRNHRISFSCRRKIKLPQQKTGVLHHPHQYHQHWQYYKEQFNVYKKK